MKTLISFIFFIALLSLNLSAQDYSNYSNHINSDIIWSDDTIKVYNDIIIEEFTTLTVNQGVYVEFQGNYSIVVYGKINAIGTQTDTIFFTIMDNTNFADTSTYLGGWGGIKLFDNENDTSIFSFCNFSYGKAVEVNTPLYSYNPNLKGGIIHLNSYNSLIVNNCSFIHNYATLEGAGIYSDDCTHLDLSYNLFKKNKVYSRGGAVFIEDCNSAIILNNLFYVNEAYRTDTASGGVSINGSGGGIAIYSTNSVVVNNEFYNNKSVSGALYESTYNSLIANNLITNNYGVGLMNGHGFAISKYTNNTVVNNKSNLPGSGIYIASEDVKLLNNIVWGNSNYFIPNQSVQIPTLMSVIADIDYSCIQDGYEGEHNIDTYPEFANPTEGAGPDYDGLNADWSLLNFSPCINTGTPDTTDLNLLENDIAGNPRIFGGRIEMGAYENQNVYVKINDSPVYSKIKLYPNPGSDKIYIDIPPEMDGGWIDIFDGQGRILMHEQINFSPAVLLPYKLTAGIYFYRIYNEYKVVKSGKWVRR